MILGLGIAWAVIVLDQLSKYYMLNEVLRDNIVINLSSFFNLVRAWNTGVSFSMFSNYGQLGVWLLSGMAVIVVIFLMWWLKTETNRWAQIALGMVIGGAIGNVVDRIRWGAVFDFLDFYWQEWHWPAFNLADSFICLGAGILILHGLLANIKKKEA